MDRGCGGSVLSDLWCQRSRTERDCAQLGRKRRGEASAMLSELEVREAARRSMMAFDLSSRRFFAYIYSSQHHCYPPSLPHVRVLSLSLSLSRYPMTSHSINQYISRNIIRCHYGPLLGGIPLHRPARWSRVHIVSPRIYFGRHFHNLGQSRSISKAAADANPNGPNERLSRRFPRIPSDRPATYIMYSSFMATLQDQFNPPAIAILPINFPADVANESILAPCARKRSTVQAL